MSSAYRGCTQYVARPDAVPGLPDAAVYPHYPHHTQIAAYLEAYVDPSGSVTGSLRTKVRHARRRDDGVWELELADGSVERPTR